MRAPAALLHARQESLHQQKNQIQIDRQHLAPLVEGDLIDRGRRINAGAVHQDVAAAKSPAPRCRGAC